MNEPGSGLQVHGELYEVVSSRSPSIPTNYRFTTTAASCRLIGGARSRCNSPFQAPRRGAATPLRSPA